MYTNFRTVDESHKSRGRHRKHVTTACEECRKGRTKCDGESPCSSCVKKERSCTYTERPDHRLAVTKRKLEDLQNDSELLHSLVNRMRQDRDHDHLISLIRSGASLEIIREAVENENLEQSSSGGSENLDLAPPRQKQALAISRLTDEPLFKVTASQWTSVTDDNHLCSHLISLWFTYGNTFNFSIVRPLFLKDAINGGPGAKYCSAFLFNCMLAEACIFSDWPEARASGGKVSDLMMRFIAEAKTHLAEETSRFSLCSMQGLLILFVVLSLANQDKEGYLLLIQSIAVSQELLHSLSKSENARSQSEEDLIYSAATKVACWGVFHISRQAILAWMIYHIMPLPPAISDLVWRDCQLGQVADLYTGYPYTQEPIQYHYRGLVNSWVELAVIGDELCTLLFKSDTANSRSDWSLLVSRLVKLEDRLESWSNNLPNGMAPDPGAVPMVYVSQYVLALVVWNSC